MQLATLHRLAQASSLAYLSIDKIPSSPYYQTSQLQPILQVVDAQSESGATVFLPRSPVDDSSVIVACRGSANLKNFGTNLQFNLVPATKLSRSDVPPDGLIHEGFQDASLGLWGELRPKLFELLRDEESTRLKNVVFTGHSLGAATALLCSIHYTASLENVFKPKPTVVSFGGPKLCNASLARFLRNTALSECDVLHLVHDKDPVLANNQILWDRLGFENVGVEMECDPRNPTVYTEERSGGRSFAWNIVDHCYYMGVFVGPRVF
ncbi:hypothetical protein HJC23_006204 [Cyclotella cryptica]|uniref:Fungal lipase-type domain-containing protein n=1 Tax=Cyclotella cryptica TaxID=29204 RepID=A0ABD3PWW7_9STRA